MMEILTCGTRAIEFEYYIIAPGTQWKLISKEEAEMYKQSWGRETKHAFKKANLDPGSADKVRANICVDHAQTVVYGAFGGYLKKIEKKELTEEAANILAPFFKYTQKITDNELV
jgi:hypothetical protein